MNDPWKRRVEIGDAVLYEGDCLEILPTLPKVDAVITDPPYFLPVQTYVNARGDSKPKRMIGEVSVLAGYFERIFETINVADGATYYVFCDAKSYPVFWRCLFPRCAHVRLLIWDKLVSFNGYTWRHQHELIAWGECDGAERVPTGDGDVLQERGVRQEDRSHPAEKPVALIRRLIDKHKKAETVLDPFMGSGTAGISTILESRKFIGIEIEPRYFDVACERITNAYRQGKLFDEPQRKPEQMDIIETSVAK